ncbi:hypothetical protein ERJ75_001211100 [Trypanosoma vivax]|nr:hypothetical protein ERJ75_001211100 [Trypanosoma vivax]
MSRANAALDGQGTVEAARLESDAAASKQSVVAPTAHLPAAPSWTINTSLEAVLLEGAAPPSDVMLSDFLRKIDEDAIPTGDVLVSIFVNNMTKYIPNEENLARLLATSHHMPYELFYRVAPFLARSRVTTVRQWAEKRGKLSLLVAT